MPRDTSKRDKFIQLVAKGGITQTEAYIQAGYSSNYAPGVISKKACNLARKHIDKINAIKEKVAKRAEEKELWSREDSIRVLNDVIKSCYKDGDLVSKSACISACAELNKMCGYNAPSKHVIKTNAVENETIDSILKNLYAE